MERYVERISKVVHHGQVNTYFDPCRASLDRIEGLLERHVELGCVLVLQCKRMRLDHMITLEGTNFEKRGGLFVVFVGRQAGEAYLRDDKLEKECLLC